MWRIGIDVGGTFTDLAAVDEKGRVVIAKCASTPRDQSEGLMEGLGLLAAECGTDLRGLLASTERIVHGTTVATNGLLERKGAKVGLLTTEGHRDVIEMREGLKDDRYNVRMPPPVPLVPRARRLGVRERVAADGRVTVPLAARSLAAALETLARARVDSVAVCYLHAYRNPRHERLTARAVARRLRGVYVSLSSVVLPQIKEYERTWTTVVNAYVGPALARYLNALRARLAARGYRGDVLIMQSHGGVAPIRESARLAAGSVLSGPAGGIAAGRYAARLLEEGSLITFDMGGTSTDIALLQHGEPSLTGEKTVGIAKVALPSLDIHTLGAGGGSIARVDPGGILHVGPESAGADPGPACYGKGGDRATVTDANVVLGFLDPANFLGGRIALDRRAAEAAVDRIARALGTERFAAAEGIAKVVDTNMAEGIKIVSVRRGVDPRKFTLVSFGGAAGLHVTEVARLLEIRRVVIPNVAAVLSAWGMLATDLRYELVRSHVSEVSRLAPATLRRLFAAMEADGRKRLGVFDGPVSVRRSLDMRYGEQIFEIPVGLDGVNLEAADLLDEIVARFHRRHEELYAYSAPGQEVVVVNARVAVVGELPPLATGRGDPVRRDAPKAARRRVWLGDWVEVPVFRLDELPAGWETKGPALFESATTTVLARAGERVSVTPHGWLDLRLS
ncbi:MAG TPA: hydantoinase/oxoprolinase family protein [Patescibacteria group bacterium]|nr:hydantoinase/oxoprolinase family protein [Patescibacteria group bacterium]